MNPLLAQNMGRWAEVYFTNPPERRNEAVHELLRELERKAGAQLGHSLAQPREQLEHDPATSISEAAAVAASDREKARAPINCLSCGESNPADQRFCGRCGSTLSSEPIPQHMSLEAIPTFTATATDDFATDEPVTQTESWLERDSDSPHETRWHFGGDDPHLFGGYEQPAPYRYRIYVGALLAVLSCALFYVAWRGTQALSGNSHPLPQAAPAATIQPAETPQPAPKKPEVENPAPPAQAALPPSGKQESSRTTGSNREQPTPAAALVEKGASEQGSPSQAQRGNGSEELAMAERYLNGGQGAARDSSEAAKWLWKSVAKQNGTAALRLSDLYLKGDGVPKNCDQAHVLLDVAGRKGIAGAATRIRNLQAFSCQ
jgi:hypothetical protein